jgi:type IV pilus assembly protein PilZ
MSRSPIVVVEAPHERRRHVRVLTRIEVDFAAEDTFLFAYITDLSVMGIFVHTENPEAPGTRLRLRFRPEGTHRPFELRGRVIWINPPRPEDWHGSRPGMGIQFTDLTDDQREDLCLLVRRLAYLDRDDGADPNSLS